MSYQRNAFTVGFYALLLKFAAWLQKIPTKTTPPPFRLMQIGSAFWQSRLLYVATRLDIATLLGEDSYAVAEMAEKLTTNPDATYRLLRVLAAMDIFEEVSPRRFKNNTTSEFLRADNPKNVRAMILMHNSFEMSRPWFESLEAGIRTGEVPFELAHGAEMFDYMDAHPEFDALFARAMDTVEALSGSSFVTDFDWHWFDRIIDVGGSKGSKSIAILQQHPHLEALVVDRLQTVSGAASFWKGQVDSSVLARVKFVDGDILQSIPASRSSKDLYMLNAVLHTFDDATCVQLLSHLASECNKTGALVAVSDVVVEELGADLVKTSFDLQMFVGTTGRERTLSELEELFRRSGLKLIEVVASRSFVKTLVVSSD